MWKGRVFIEFKKANYDILHILRLNFLGEYTLGNGPAFRNCSTMQIEGLPQQSVTGESRGCLWLRLKVHKNEKVLSVMALPFGSRKSYRPEAFRVG